MTKRAGGTEDIYKITRCPAVIGLVKSTNSHDLVLVFSERCGFSRMWEETRVSRDQQQSSLNYFQQHTQITDIMEACSFCSTACVGEEEAGKWICDLVWSYMTNLPGI